MDDADRRVSRSNRRQLAYVHGRWHVTYLSTEAGDGGRRKSVHSGHTVGRFFVDSATSRLVIRVVPSGDAERIVVGRDALLTVETPPLRSAGYSAATKPHTGRHRRIKRSRPVQPPGRRTFFLYPVLIRLVLVVCRRCGTRR